MTYSEIVIQVAERLGLSKEFVNKVYRGYWRAIREHISSLPLKENLTDEEFSRLQPNVNIPSLGKLYVTLDRYKAIRENYKKNINKKENKDVTYKQDNSDIQSCTDYSRQV